MPRSIDPPITPKESTMHKPAFILSILAAAVLSASAAETYTIDASHAEIGKRGTSRLFASLFEHSARGLNGGMSFAA